MAVPASAPSYTGSYVQQYVALATRAYAVTYNASADELVIVGDVLPQGLPGMQGLDPTSLAVRWSLSTPSPGNAVAVSDDGRKAYIGLCEQRSIAQIDLAARSIDSVFPLGNPSQELCAGDIAVRPGHATEIAATALLQNVLAPRSYGTVMFANGVRLPLEVNDPNSQFVHIGNLGYTGSAVIEFLGPNALIGYSELTSNPQIQRYSASSQGLTLTGLQPGADLGMQMTVRDGRVFFGRGVVANAADMAGLGKFDDCANTFLPANYNVATPDATRPEMVCVTSVSDRQRENPQDVVLEIATWTLQGQRLTRHSRLNLRDVIQISAPATAEVQMLNAIVLPGGQLVLHIYDFQNDRVLVVALPMSTLKQLEDKPVHRGQFTQDGTTIDWLDVPASSTAFDSARNRLYGIVPGAYGPKGSSVVTVDAATKEVLGFILLDIEPKVIKLSSDGQFAYVVGNDVVQQVDLVSMTRGWSWKAPDCVVSSIAPRPGFAQQVAVMSGDSVRLIDSGVETSRVARDWIGLCWPSGMNGYQGQALFTSSDRLIEFHTDRMTGTVSTYAVSSAGLAAQAPIAINFVIGGAGFTNRVGSGYVYNYAGDVAELSTLGISSVASLRSSYESDATTGVAVDHIAAGYNETCSCSMLTAFAPLSTNRFLAVRQYFDGVAMFDINAGTTKAGRVLMTNLAIGSSFLDPTVLDASTIAFGQWSPVGEGSIQFLRFGF